MRGGALAINKKRGLTFKVVPFFNVTSLLGTTANNRNQLSEANGITSIAQAQGKTTTRLGFIPTWEAWLGHSANESRSYQASTSTSARAGSVPIQGSEVPHWPSGQMASIGTLVCLELAFTFGKVQRRISTNPNFLTNILLACLIAFKVLISAFDRTAITPTDFVVLLVAAIVFYVGMLPIAEYFTGQKTITMWKINSGTKIRRDETCSVKHTLLFSVFMACSGAAMIMTVGS